MAFQSRAVILGNAIVSTLNADADLAAYGFALRKKPYNRSNPTGKFGVVVMPTVSFTAIENVVDELAFAFRVVVAVPEDGNLASNLADFGAIERVADLFRNRSHGFMPLELRTTAQSALTAASGAGLFSSTVIERCTSQITGTYVDPAFEAGYDASQCSITVFCRATR